jgi:hypothetical protein
MYSAYISWPLAVDTLSLNNLHSTDERIKLIAVIPNWFFVLHMYEYAILLFYSRISVIK